MSQSRLAHLLSCVLMAPHTIAASATEPSSSYPIAVTDLTPCLDPDLGETAESFPHDEFERAASSLDLTPGQRETIEHLVSATDAASTDGTFEAVVRRHEVVDALAPDQREVLVDRVEQLRTEDRVIERLRDAGAA